jgi:hypothetical protein
VVKSSAKAIDLFADELQEPEAVQGKSVLKAKLQRCIDNWQKELEQAPDPYGIQNNSEKYTAIKRAGTLMSWIKQYQTKLAELDKPVRREPLKLANGTRSLSKNDCKKMNGVLNDAVNNNKLTMIEAKQTLSSMVDSILHGYYKHENVDVAKSVNSVIKKFKNDEWVSSGIIGKDKPSRPHPAWFDCTEFRNKINLRGM